MKFLNVTKLKFKELGNEGRLQTVLATAKLNLRQPGHLLEESPDNIELYQMSDLKKLKTELDAERKARLSNK